MTTILLNPLNIPPRLPFVHGTELSATNSTLSSAPNFPGEPFLPSFPDREDRVRVGPPPGSFRPIHSAPIYYIPSRTSTWRHGISLFQELEERKFQLHKLRLIVWFGVQNTHFLKIAFLCHQNAHVGAAICSILNNVKNSWSLMRHEISLDGSRGRVLERGRGSKREKPEPRHVSKYSKKCTYIGDSCLHVFSPCPTLFFLSLSLPFHVALSNSPTLSSFPLQS